MRSHRDVGPRMNDLTKLQHHVTELERLTSSSAGAVRRIKEEMEVEDLKLTVGNQ